MLLSASAGGTMVLFNYATKEITAKVVYYGPGLCGKTTNLQFIYDSLPSNNRSKMLSLATKTDRTLFFDFLPLELGRIRGMRTKLQLYTVPGQVYYNSTRQLVLKGADGVVFVADSQDSALDANHDSLQNLEDNLKRQGIRIKEIPLVFQYNKRDLPNALPVTEIDREINKLGVPYFKSVATTGIGVEETLKGITGLVIAHLVRKYGLDGSDTTERDIQILNTPMDEPHPVESLWEDADETMPLGPSTPPSNAPTGEMEFDLDDASGHEAVPLVPTELVGAAAGQQERAPFDETFFETSGPAAKMSGELDIPMMSIEIPLPPGIADSLPRLDGQQSIPTAQAPPSPGTERKAAEGLVKEVSIPLNLSLSELRDHRRLRLKITLDVNLLP